MRYLLFLAFLMQSLAAIENTAPVEIEAKQDLRMGFNNGKTSLSVLFPKEFTLKFQKNDIGHEIYYATHAKEGHHTTYHFGCHGFALEGLATFKDTTLENIKSEFLKLNPHAESSVTLDEKGDRLRAIIDHADQSGKRAVFVGDFLSVGGKIYLISETFEIAENETRDALSIIDNAFFDSFTVQNR